MEPLKVQYATIDEIPETFRPLYEERGGQFLLTKINGLKTDADVARVQRALDSEKTAHAGMKNKWGQFFGTRTPEEVQADLDALPELREIAASKNINQDKLNELADARARNKIVPFERENATLKQAVAERDQKIKDYERADVVRTIKDNVRGEVLKAKVVETAVEDVLMYAEQVFELDGEGNTVTKEGVPGVTPGLSPAVWLTEQQNKRPHWWPPSKGGGAGGGNGFNGVKNPWSAEHWNVTEQGKMVRENRQKAEQLAGVANSRIGATRPTVSK